MKPFLKWAGGKARLAGSILDAIGDFKGDYHEPFLGGGAVFLALGVVRARPGFRVHLADMNAHLVNTWTAVRGMSAAFSRTIVEYNDLHGRDAYTRQRELFNRQTTPNGTFADLQAARMIWLNKHGFNGLYRVNRKGEFNVPWGKREKTDLGLINLQTVSTWLRVTKATIRRESFAKSIARVKADDVVYLDPPYPAVFDSYTPERFGIEEHAKLVLAAQEAAQRGARVVASMGDHEVVDAWLSRSSNIGVTSSRKTIREFLIQGG